MGGADAHAQGRMWTLHQVLAAVQRLNVLLTADSSAAMRRLAPAGAALANTLSIGTAQAETAVEDSVRAMPQAPLAQLLALLEPALQRAVGAPAWRIIAPITAGQPEVRGLLAATSALGPIQDTVYDEPTVLIVGQVCLHNCSYCKF